MSTDPRFRHPKATLLAFTLIVAAVSGLIFDQKHSGRSWQSVFLVAGIAGASSDFLNNFIVATDVNAYDYVHDHHLDRMYAVMIDLIWLSSVVYFVIGGSVGCVSVLTKRAIEKSISKPLVRGKAVHGKDES